jgi:hypothetical protein
MTYFQNHSLLKQMFLDESRSAARRKSIIREVNRDRDKS